MKKSRKILLALDFTEDPSDVFEKALMVAGKYNASIYMLHVIHDMPRLSFYSDAYQLWEEFRDKAVKDTLQEMENYIKKFSSDFKDIEPIIDVGIPHIKIADRAKELDVDLIILGTHARKGIDHLMHTNCSEKILKMVDIPLLIFHIK